MKGFKMEQYWKVGVLGVASMSMVGIPEFPQLIFLAGGLIGGMLAYEWVLARKSHRNYDC